MASRPRGLPVGGVVKSERESEKRPPTEAALPCGLLERFSLGMIDVPTAQTFERLFLWVQTVPIRHDHAHAAG
jgi:hypothetical protein